MNELNIDLSHILFIIWKIFLRNETFMRLSVSSGLVRCASIMPSHLTLLRKVAQYYFECAEDLCSIKIKSSTSDIRMRMIFRQGTLSPAPASVAGYGGHIILLQKLLINTNAISILIISSLLLLLSQICKKKKKFVNFKPLLLKHYISMDRFMLFRKANLINTINVDGFFFCFTSSPLLN
uniref:Uncharacterized protein n=1 Tax=Glossina morsitans morsitans TaxID=37546 RepID=A0ABK9N7T9_GLOMM